MFGRAATRELHRWSAVPIRCTALAFALAFCIAGTGHAQLPQTQLRNIITANQVPLDDAGVRIVSVRTGQTLFENCGEKLFIPASNVKLATTAAAFYLLGADYRFRTVLYARGEIADGTLTGDLIVVGGGDPDISGRFHDANPCFLFRQWARDLARHGIRTVNGNLVGDATAFDDETIHPSWPRNQLEKWYCAPVSALTLNDNCVDIAVAAGPGPGAPAKLLIVPGGGYATVDNRCSTTANKAEHLYGFLGRAGSAPLILRGKFWTGGYTATTSIPVENPALFFLTEMKAALAEAGIAITGRTIVAPGPTDAAGRDRLIAVYESDLATAVEVANKRSQNVYAELILKTIGREHAGTGTFESGAEAVRGFLADISEHGGECVIADGSGLSHDGRLSAAVLTDLLCWIARRPEISVFGRSLATAGADGTLERRLSTPPCSGRVKGKTGTVAGVATLSGYIDVPGDTLAFAMLMNNRRAGIWRMRQAQDAIIRAVIDHFDKAAGGN